MRVVDFLQFIFDLDKKYQFYFEVNDQIYPIGGFFEDDSYIILTTKKKKQSGLHQWELIALLGQITDKRLFMQVEIDHSRHDFYGIQIQSEKILLK